MDVENGMLCLEIRLGFGEPRPAKNTKDCNFNLLNSVTIHLLIIHPYKPDEYGV